MKGKAKTEQFNGDVEKVLRQMHPEGSERWPETYRREMEVVRALASADLSAESTVRLTLKRRLLAAQPGRVGRGVDSQILQRRLLRSGLALLLTALLLLAASPLGAILAQTVIRTVQSWQLGENTTAVSVDGDFEALPGEAGDTVILPAIGTTTSPEEIVPVFEGDPGQERTIIFDSMVPLDAAQEQVSFPLKQPGFIPEGYELQGAVVIHPGQASLEYFSRQDSRMIGLLQTAVGGSDGEVQVTFTSDMVVQEVEVGGNPGLWTQVEDEGLLIWEAAGVNYQLAGLSERELALQVAKSIQ